MNIITETIAWIQEQARERIVEVDGRQYFDTGSIDPILEPEFPKVGDINSLTGFVDYINKNPDGFDMDSVFIVIYDYRNVFLLTKPYGIFKQRDVILHVRYQEQFVADADVLEMSVEETIVNLNTLFEETADRQALLQMISNIKLDDETGIVDDGFTQRVHVKTGVTTVSEQVVKNPIVLQPIVTFPEIEQPEVFFYVRLSRRIQHPRDPENSKSAVRLRLHQQKGELWKMGCVDLITEYLESSIDGTVPVIR